MRLYLVRHTQVDVPQGICYGQSDVGLAGSFSEEVATIRKQLESAAPFEKAYCSPLKRCVLLTQNLTDDFTMDERIKEHNFGDWENKNWNDIYASDEGKKWFEDYVNTVCPGGESFKMMLERVRDFINDLPSYNEKVLIVTHAGIIRAFLILLKDYSINKAFDTPISYGEVITLTL